LLRAPEQTREHDWSWQASRLAAQEEDLMG
jgi:hypothetical protein